MDKLLALNQYRVLDVFAYAHEELGKRWLSWKDSRKLLKQKYEIEMPRSTWFKALDALIERDFVCQGARGLYSATVKGLDFFHVNEEISDFEKKVEPQEIVSLFYSRTRNLKSIILHFVVPRKWKPIKLDHDLYDEIHKIDKMLVRLMGNLISMLLTEKSSNWSSAAKVGDIAIILWRSPRIVDWTEDVLDKIVWDKLTTENS